MVARSMNSGQLRGLPQAVRRQMAQPRIEFLVVAGALLVICVLLWLPFGFDVPPYADGINYYTHVYRDAVNGSGLLTNFSGRPLAYLAGYLGYHLNLPGFTGLNLVLFGLLLGKGLLLYGIIRPLFGKGAAFAGAVLCAVMPFEATWFYLGAVNIHLAGGLFLLAVYLLVSGAGSRRRHLYYFGAALASGASLLTYEAGAVLLLLAPALAIWLDERPRRTALVALIPYYGVTAGVLLAVTLPGYLGADSYQAALFARTDLPLPLYALWSMVRAYAHLIWGGWQEALAAGIQPAYAGISLAGSLLVGVVTLALNGGRRVPRWKSLLILSLVTIGAGFFMYAPTAYLENRASTFQYAGIGGALFAVLVIAWIASRVPFGRVLQAAAVAGLFFFACQLALANHKEFYRRGTEQQLLVATLARQAPGFTPGTAVVLMVPPDTTAPFPLNVYFEDLLRLSYRDISLWGFICTDPGTPPNVFNERCTLTPTGIQIDSGNENPLLPYGDVVMFSYGYQMGGLLEDDLRVDGVPAPGYDPLARIRYSGVSPVDVTPGALALWQQSLRQSDIAAGGNQLHWINAPADAEGVFISGGWYDDESFAGETFRWASNDAGIIVSNPRCDRPTLRMDIAPGPSVVDGEPLRLEIVNERTGEVLLADTLDARTTLESALPPSSCGVVRYRLHALNSSGLAGSPADSRVLTYRVFSITLQPGDSLPNGG